MRQTGLLAAVDPGRSKCGVVLADPRSHTVLAAAILPPQEARDRIARWQQQGMAAVVLGNGTGSAAWQHHLQQLGLTVLLVDERGTTLAARERYWDLEGRRHWRRWLPAGLRVPPRDIDDVVAQLLLERHLGRCLARGPEPIRTGPGP
ncbi:MAG: resolvase [Cyanobium sp. Prado107]|nr:resolvase [Cyanobium sp. Prado107]